MSTPNRALFDCDSDGEDAGFDASLSATVHFSLRSTAGVTSWILQVFNPAGFSYGVSILDNAPEASKGAPLLTLVGDTSGQSVSKTPVAGQITAVMPGSGTNSWIVRSVVNGGYSDGKPNASLIHERILATRAVLGGLRKPVVTELRQYEDESWAGAICDLIDAANDGGLVGTGVLQMVPVATVVISDVANLAAGPTANDGVTTDGKIVALAFQSNPAHNKLHSVASGVYTPLATQPPEEALLTVKEGVFFLNSIWKYKTGAITAISSSIATLVGTNTTVVIAPDLLGVPLIDNEGGGRLSVANDAAFHTLWSFDFVGRGYTTGTLTVLALIKAVDGAKRIRLRLECEIACSATPAIDAVTNLDTLDDSGGAGGYADARFQIVSTTRLELQVKNSQGSAVKFVAIVGLVVGTP